MVTTSQLEMFQKGHNRTLPYRLIVDFFSNLNLALLAQQPHEIL